MIFCVEDDSNIRELVVYTLETTGFKARGFEDGKEFLEALALETPELVLMDIMLPGEDGIELLKRLKASPKTRDIPVIMVTAKGAEYDKVKGLDLGADDYITKPFVPLEAVARVNSNIRRFYQLGTKGSGQESVRELVVRDLRLDLESCMLYRAEAVIELTSVEFKIMKLFMENPGKVFTKQQIFEQGWEEEYMISDNNVMVCISKLRSKLDTEDREYIRTIRGLGYRLEKE